MPPVQGRVADALAQPDGKAVVLLASRTFSRMVVARTLPNGQLDTGFGAGGTRVVELPGQAVLARALGRQPDGKLLAVGSAQHPGLLRLLVARLDGGGTLDPAFSGDGRLTVSVPSADRLDAAAVVVQPDGRILVVAVAISGLSSNGVGRIVVTRLLPDGGLDPGYGTLGRFEFPLPGAQGRPVSARAGRGGQPRGGRAHLHARHRIRHWSSFASARMAAPTRRSAAPGSCWSISAPATIVSPRC